ncbi:hypothetical protein C0Q70_17142 [Pomacea canaliculata]|uniref:Regucalcin n=1 Tax=Pomacea canaliculata TaxID=400727 RepID=A0A2T7NRT4_POMCA|nr:hypothetical protein C0Q70_17142 [Pomacea canaliculata]
MASPTVEVAIKNSCSKVGEGPHWDDTTQSLLYVDVIAHDVHRWNSVTGEDTKVHLKDTVGHVIPRRRGGYMVGLGRKLSLLEWETGTVTDIAEVDQETRNRVNDAKCDAKGRLWTGTMGAEVKPGVFEPAVGSLYSLDLDHTVKKWVSGIDLSNGFAWTEDNQTMFYIDSIPKKVYAFDYDLENGAISNQRTAVDLTSFDFDTDTYSVPDGMTIDTEGKLWVACFGAGAVFKFDPETGKTLQCVKIPAKQTTSVCWGGKNLDELYVTCGRLVKPEEYYLKEEPLAGSVFRVTGLGAKGRPANVFEDWDTGRIYNTETAVTDFNDVCLDVGVDGLEGKALTTYIVQSIQCDDSNVESRAKKQADGLQTAKKAEADRIAKKEEDDR